MVSSRSRIYVEPFKISKMQQTQINFQDPETACTIACVTASTGKKEIDYSCLNNKNFTKDAYKYTSCNHELAKDEIWLGNTYGNEQWTKGVDIPIHYSALKTIRLGEQAYCIKGKPLSRDYCRPLILNKSEQAQHEEICKERIRKASMGYL